MKSHVFSLAAIAALALSGCQKPVSPNLNNPPVRDIPAERFSLTVCDGQQGTDSLYRYFATLSKDSPDGTVIFDRAECGGSTWEYAPDEVTLIQTPCNTITFESDRDVNAASEDACLDIVREDSRHYRIKYVGEGSSTIRFWNGDNGENSISIRLQAAASVKCQGFELRLDGKTYFLQEQDVAVSKVNWNACRFETRLPVACKSTVWEEIKSQDKGLELIEKVSDVSLGMVLEFVGTIPRNATPDNRLYRRIDPIGQSITPTSAAYDNGYPPFAIWNEKYWPQYRWMPKGDSDPDKIYAGSSYKSCNPADIRYRKVWIWNQNFYKGGLGSLDECFGFFFYDGSQEKSFWGAIGGAPQEP